MMTLADDEVLTRTQIDEWLEKHKEGNGDLGKLINYVPRTMTLQAVPRVPPTDPNEYDFKSGTTSYDVVPLPNPLLSILIPTVSSRSRQFNFLMRCLNAQRNALPDPNVVEIVTLCDNGEMMVGAKRNRLLDMSKGEYLCFFDDDDEPFSGYMERILKALETRPDVVGIMIYWSNNLYTHPRLLIRSLDYGKIHWIPEVSKDVSCGRPAHLNPTRSSIAKSERFPENVIAGEDSDWSARVAGKLATCVNISEPIYWYNYSDKGTLTQRPGIREMMRPPLPEGHQRVLRDGVVVELNRLGNVVSGK